MKALGIIILVAIVAILGFWLSQKGEREQVQISPPTAPPLSEANETLSVSPAQSPSPSPKAPESPAAPAQQVTTAAPRIVVINITDSGSSPSEINIKAGDTVRFVNQSSQLRWPASAVHPNHELYPGSSISKCGTPEANKIFDACRGLKTGEAFSFTFKVKGTWPFHDHLAPLLRGQIIVQ